MTRGFKRTQSKKKTGGKPERIGNENHNRNRYKLKPTKRSRSRSRNFPHPDNLHKFTEIKSFYKMSEYLKHNPELQEFITVEERKYNKKLRTSRKKTLTKFINKFTLKNDRLYYRNRKVVLFLPKIKI